MEIVNKIWGCEIWWANTDKYMGKELIINPNCSTSLHYHVHKDETIYVTRGVLIVSGFREMKINEGESIHIPPKAEHRLSAGPKGVILMESSTPHPKDSVRAKL